MLSTHRHGLALDPSHPCRRRASDQESLVDSMSHSQLIVLAVCTRVIWPSVEDKDVAGGSARLYGLSPHLWTEAGPAEGRRAGKDGAGS